MEIPEAVRALVRRTPIVRADALGVRLKLENLQRTGSFKLRGAALKLVRLGAAARARGVVAASAGNHGLGLAAAAAWLGVPALVVTPAGAAAVKRAGIAALGAEVRTVPGGYQDAERAAIALAAELERPFVSPFDDEDVIDGNGGWLGAEIMDQGACDAVVAPVGGGGLIAGLARELAPRGVRVIGVQPAANCAMHDSLAQGRALTVYQGGATACEGLEGAVAERTFEVVRAHRVEMVLVEEDEVWDAVAYAYRQLGLVIETSAAVGIAAARAGKLPAGALVVVTGGNLDAEVLDRALARP